MSIEWLRLGELVEFDRTPIELDPDVEYERLGIYSWGKGHFVREPASGLDMGKMNYFTFPRPALVFSNIQAWEGAVALTDEADETAVCSSRFYPYVPRTDSDVSLRYLFEFFRSSIGQRIMREQSSGTQVRNKLLSRSGMEAALVPLPPRPEQDRIATYLDGLAARTAAGSSAQQLAAALEGTASLVARDAPKRPFGTLLKLERRRVDLEAAETYREIGVKSFGRGLFIKEPITGAELGAKRVFAVEAGDLIVSNVFAWEGAVSLAESEHHGLIGSHRFMTWTGASPDIDLRFLREYLRTSIGVAALASASPGSAGRNRTLSVANLERIEVPVPALALQQRVARLGARVDEIHTVMTQRDRLRSALLPAARNEIFSSMR